MVSLDDLRDLTLYKKPFFLPVDPKDKRRGSAIMLLTPNYKSSMLAMTAPYTINRRYFESYYVEKSVMRLITNESAYEMEDSGEYVFEQTLSSDKRNELPDSEFGIPEERKYPMPDKDHVHAAIRFFNHVEEKYEKELAKNIITKIGKFGMANEVKVGEKNRFKPYWENSALYAKTQIVDEFYIEPVEDNFNYDEYLNEFVVNSALKIVDQKLGNSSNIVFSGYAKDISEVKKFFDIKSGIKPFNNLEMKAPKKINVIVLSDSSADDEMNSESLTIFTPKAFSTKGYRFKYADYIKFMLQLFAIETIKTSVGKMVLPNIAEPLAVLLSGICEDEIADPYKDGFDTERLFKYIIDTYGIRHMVDIARTNNITLIMKYAKELANGKGFRESDLLIDDDIYQYLKEEGEVSVDNPIPESIKAIQNMATKLKRRIRQHTIYKLNKIMRDISRGNIGKEERGAGMTTLQQLQSGDISGISKTEEVHTEEQVKRWSNGDYIMEGNVMYLFESNDSYDTMLRRALYKDRFKNNKEVLNHYKQVKASCPFIKYSFTDLYRYAKKNLFVDLSYYNESFFKNMAFLNDEDKKNTLRIFGIYAELMERLLKDDKLSDYKKKTIFIPVLDWRHNNSIRMWMYKDDINPISVIFHYIKYDQASLKKLFKDYDVVFLGGKNYFKINFAEVDFSKGANVTKFITLIRRVLALGYDSPADPDPEGEFADSPMGIAMDLIDKVERSQNVDIDDISKFVALKKSIDLVSPKDEEPKVPEQAERKRTKASNIVGGTAIVSTPTITAKEVPTALKTKIVDNPKSDTKQTSDNKAVNNTSEADKKDAIVDAIAKVADNAQSVDDALDKLNTDEFKEMIAALHTDSEDNVRVDKARASKVIAIEDEFHEKEVAGKSVKDMLNTDPAKEELKKSNLKVASINKDWENMTFMNFDKDYDPNTDIIKMLDSMQHWTFPIAVKNVDVHDNSTSEDVLDLWTIDCIDFKGTKFTIKVDIPRFVNGSNFLKLRGNEKNLMIQSLLIPIIKSGLDECQIIGSGGYNKVFVRRFGSRRGQSMPSANKLLRALNRYGGEELKVIPGDNAKVCSKYELPMDYIDVATAIDSIECGNCKFFFNQDELRSTFIVDDKKGIPVGVQKIYDKEKRKAVESIIYYNTEQKKIYPTIIGFIGSMLCNESSGFADYYKTIVTAGSRFTYSKASILSTEIPVVIVCAYLEGLISTLKKARVSYQFVQKIDKSMNLNDQQDYIKFKDGYLIYDVNYSASLLLNGLKECDTESYSIKDINSKKMYMELLENYGSLKSDGLENAYDCLIDPITKEILEMYKLPTDFISVLLHASNLLADNKYVRHIDQAGRRWRRKELIAGYFYKALSTSYIEYANSVRHNRKNSKMTMKQSAVIDFILSKDPATSDLSINNVINDVECANTVTNKGLVGMNNARAYSVGTRTYDESMLNVLGMDTAFSGNVGINRQATIDANIEGGRGLIKTIDGDTDKLSVAKTLTITEAVTPLGSTHDDPQRTLMTFLQTSKHMIRCENNDPTLITNGADEALPYLASDIFAYKAKEDGVVIEKVTDGTNDHIIIEYKSGKHEYIDLTEQIKKNSDGGYFVPLKLDSEYEVGKKFKAGEVLAYDKLSFSKSLGESGNLAANIGTLAKVAIINTDEGFEDSAAITESFAEKIGTAVIMSVETVIDKGSNIFVYKNIGDNVMEGDTLLSYQTDFEDDVVNTLLKNLTIDEKQLSELGRNPVKSKYTGIVAGIDIYRTCDTEEMSPSLRHFVDEYESKIKRTKADYKKYDIDASMLPADDKVDQVGKAKNVNDAVKIVYYIKYIDNMSVGDKIVFYSANKGIIKYIIPKEEEPYTDFRPNEHVDSFMSLSSISGRMTCSIPIFASISKLMVELDRSVKDIAGIPYDESKL